MVSTELPTGVTNPRPVTTTRRFKFKAPFVTDGTHASGVLVLGQHAGGVRTLLPSLCLVLIDVVVRIAHALNLFGASRYPCAPFLQTLNHLAGVGESRRGRQ